MYKEWLYLTCKWSTIGLDDHEMKVWQHYTTKLEKHCQHCAETFECESCHNTGLDLTGVEYMIIRNIEMSLELNKANSVN